jgi:hypothetical protein
MSDECSAVKRSITIQLWPFLEIQSCLERPPNTMIHGQREEALDFER